jgi:hypothetical protein
MSTAENPYQAFGLPVAAEADVETRADFISKTYVHLGAAVMTFVGLEMVLLNLPGIENLIALMFGNQISYLITFIGFIAVSHIADRWARSATSLSTQYMGLGLFIVAEAVFFLPLLYFAKIMGQNNPSFANVIPTAGLVTALLFIGMTGIVFVTRKDFSFLRSILMLGGLVAFGLIICAILFGFQLGPIFSVAMIGFACGYILYDTSNVLHHYRIGQHVAASLALFASVALLFWYVLRLFMSRD